MDLAANSICATSRSSMDPLHRRAVVHHQSRHCRHLVSSEGQKIPHATQLDFPTTNNAAKYEALLLCLRKAKTLRARRLII